MRRLSEARRQDGLTRWERRTEGPLLGLSVLFVVVLILPFIVDPPPTADALLFAVNVIIWAAFTVDYVSRLYLAPQRRLFVRSHLLDLLIVVLPFLGRFVRCDSCACSASAQRRRFFTIGLAGLSTPPSRCTSPSRSLVRCWCRPSPCTTSNAVRRTATSRRFPDALWWAVTTVTTVGYGDRYPTTTLGRLVAAALMLVGIALLGVVTATIATWFVDRLRVVQEAEERTEATLEDVMQELRALRARLDDRERDSGPTS